MTRVTVGICTWNRASLLDQTLTAMHSLQIPPGVDWELLVVNNNCTDNTDEVIERHLGLLPLKRLHEPRPGLSHARNRVLDSVEGDLLLWTDDDVLVDPMWLSSYVDAARTWPDASFFGGPILPWYETKPPRWLSKNVDLVGGVFALLNYGSHVGPLAPGNLPYGANMGVCVDSVAGRRFDPRMGKTQLQILPGEETTFFREMAAEGRFGIWVGSARVSHYIATSRLRLRSVVNFYEDFGRVSVIKEGMVAGKRRINGVPLWYYRKCSTYLLKSIILWPTGSRAWMTAFKGACIARGSIRQIMAGS